MIDGGEFSIPSDFLSEHPIINPLPINTRHPFSGRYGFKLCAKKHGSGSDSKIYSDESGFRQLFVSRNRPFELKVNFHYPLTPINLYLRIIPFYTHLTKKDDIVCRCANHTTSTTNGSNSEFARSFVTANSPRAQYTRLHSHLSVLVPLDRFQLSFSDEERRDDIDVGQQCSYPMGVVSEALVCQLHCYTSCLGGQVLGATELVFRLEEIKDDDSIVVHGVDRIAVHCSYTPTRDIKIFSVRKTAASPSVGVAPQPNRRSRGSSECVGNSKGCPPLTSNRPDEASNNHGDSVVALSGSSEDGCGSSEDTGVGPYFIDLPVSDCEEARSGSSGTQRYYVVVTKSKEMALHARANDDSRVAFRGISFSKTKFLDNRLECEQVERRLVAALMEDIENQGA